MRRDDHMPLPLLITTTYATRCRECDELINIGASCYWRRGERPVCVSCYNALHDDDIVNVVTPVTTTTTTTPTTTTTTPLPVGSPTREERISQMHLEKMLMLGEIVAAVKALTAAEEKRNAILMEVHHGELPVSMIKKEADR